MTVPLWMLIVLALAVAGLRTLLDEILFDMANAEPGLKDTERRSGSECRT